MDRLTVLGLLTAFMAVIIGQIFEGGDLNALFNMPALFIVLGGTLGAVMIQTPFRIFRHAFTVLPWIFRPPVQTFEHSRDRLIELARKARQYGLLALDQDVETETNPLMRKGLELLVMGIDTPTIRQVLEAEMDRYEDQEMRAAHVFESMGGYSPTIGILGAVLGLIQVMRNLNEPSELGTGIAVAFVATIYGVGFANLMFLPIANKLKNCIAYQVHHDEMIIEGIVAMASGESPHMLTLKLNNYGQKRHSRKKK